MLAASGLTMANVANCLVAAELAAPEPEPADIGIEIGIEIEIILPKQRINFSIN